MPPWASLVTVFNGDSVVVDSLLWRFPDITISPVTYFNGCLGSFEQHDWILFTNVSAPPDVYIFNAGLAAAGDTVQFVYDTESLFTGQRDTLGIWSADEVRLPDGTLVGWNVTFGEYNYCLEEWQDRLQIFVGLLPSTIEMTFEPATIAPGDTAAIVLKKVNPDNTREDFPPAQLFEIGIVNNSDDGGILSPTPSPVVSDYFLNFEQPFAFIAENSIAGDSVIVQIRAGVPPPSSAAVSYQETRYQAWQRVVAERRAETLAAIGTAPSPAPSARVAKKNFGEEPMPRGNDGRGLGVTSDMPESEFVYLDFVKANVVIKKVLHHFEVTAEPDTLARTAKLDTSTITVEAKDKNDEDVTIPDNTLLDFALDAIGMQLGNLIAPNGSQAKSLAGISYGDARVGKVKYVANGDFADSTQQVKITVSNSEDASRKGSDSLAVQCHILPPRYAQDGGDWGDDIYDTTNDDIATLGCALSSEAFVMTVFGDTINPGELNTWMKEKTGKEGGFYGRKVNWYAMEKHTPGIMDITYYQKDMWTKDNKLDSTQITNPAVLDDPLSECRLIIVRVYNKDTGNEHWVVVTGRENGRYTIMDPGKGEDYLDGYGAFWNYVVITKL